MLLVYRCNMLQVSDSHEGFVEIVQLQNTGQQEEARDQNTAEEFGQSKCFQTDRCQPEDDRGTQLHLHYFSFKLLLSFLSYCA